MAKVHVSLQILPMVERDRLYQVVDRVIEYIRSSGVRYVVGPMETTMEGEMDELLDIVKEAHRICEQEGAWRVAAVIKIDYVPEGVSFEEKLEKYR
ncbi:protein of unknown function DUF77 [Spirochaeta thermophila DSM 6578]|uniref:Thiamine-binding protein domain-containing protein n=1 Tax=Winmispira thermophila (strain ATCC 700085 / DSM 6578 / Z-1203) TaxID=869211 RepID=G0GDU2_WINT7|nr:thiamine-binding protein [Spirochaeta thermophila]AEJ62222.1 protein of unknown function DUF77 [Spirochaeta thermophila DSM 6578]